MGDKFFTRRKVLYVYVLRAATTYIDQRVFMLSSGKAVHKLQQTWQCVQGLFGRRKKKFTAQKEKLTMCIHDHLGPAIFKRKKITTFFVRQIDGK